jgi:glyoxylase-like metal-dependent hydrolase (beta-lactamase superfamily II)
MSRVKLLLCLSTTVAIAGAQAPPQVVTAPRIDFDNIEIRTTRLSEDFFTLDGQGGRISVLTGPDGVFMVDTQFAPLTEKIVAAIRQVTDQPIRFVVDTHVHPDHTGGNENFAARGALIFSRDQLRCRLIHPAPGPDGKAPPSAPTKALPVVTYDGPVTLHINGEDVRLIPIRAAHTDGDTLVRFPKHDALAVGDYFRSVQYPFVDVFNGGTLDGLLAALAETIALAGPNTRIIPGHGPIVDRNAVIAQRELVVSMRDRMLPLVRKGLTLDQVLAEKLTADTDASIPDGKETSERFVRWMYAELTHPPRTTCKGGVDRDG